MDYASEKEWKTLINSLENDFNSLETNKKRAIREVGGRIVKSVKKNAADNCGVLFSGGIDSTLISFILKKLNIDFICYSVGLENAQDIEWAEKVARALGFKLKTRILSLDGLETVVKAVTNILKEADVMKVSVGSVFYSASLLAKKDGINILFSGLGSEEIFAGYERHLNAMQSWENVHKECWNGLKNMWERDMKRDFLIAKHNNIELRLPFLDKEVIASAMNIHPMYKISKDEKKIILREIAQEMGLPKEFAWRKKKAAQYGSNFIKGLDKLARMNRFEYKKDYLRSLV